jgi:hypothetical protein
MPDYSEGRIYKIICNETDEIYIGSCFSDLDTRLRKHKTYRDCSAVQILDRNNYQMLLIENYPCETEKQLRWRERYWYENIKCINKRRPIVTKEEEKQQEKNYAQSYKERRNIVNKKRNHYIKSWGYNNYLGTRLNLLDIDTTLFH